MPDEVVRQLLPGERILWEGAPRQGVRVRLIDVPMIVFGLFFAAIGGVIAIAAFPFGLLIPHFWIGAYFAAGQFWIDAKVRRGTAYAVTQSRAIVVRRWPRYRSTTINLLTVPEINVQHHRDGTGTINFGPSWSALLSPTSLGRRAPAFEFITDVDEVARLVHTSALSQGL